MRVKQGDTLGGWTIREVRPQELVLARGAEHRTFDVKRGPDLVPDAPATASQAPAARNQNSGPLTGQQQLERDAENSKASVNAIRARLGMPLIP